MRLFSLRPAACFHGWQGPSAVMVAVALLSACGSAPPPANVLPNTAAAAMGDLPPIYLQSHRRASDVTECLARRLGTRAVDMDTTRGPAKRLHTDDWDLVVLAVPDASGSDNDTLVAADYSGNGSRAARAAEPALRFAVARCTL